MGSNSNESPYKGSAQITREQFLFYEMRTTAKLMREGLEDNEIIDRIVEDNLFQYPTEKSIRQMAKACVARLKGMGDGAGMADSKDKGHHREKNKQASPQMTNNKCKT